MPPEIYLLSPPNDPFMDELDAVLTEGVSYFQYRRPDLSDAERYDELKEVTAITRNHPTKLIVNNRPDLARGAEAEGVHLGEEDLPVEPVKAQWPNLEVGRTHRVGDELNEAADYYGIGPVFSSFTKDLAPEPCGWSGVRKVVAEAEKPVYAIGGIEASRLEDVPEGLAGICVLGAVWDQPDPVSAVKILQERLKS